MSEALRNFIGDWHALVILLIAGVFPNQIWRMLALWFGSGIDEGSELLIWVRAVGWPVCRDGCALPHWRRGLRVSSRRDGRSLPAWPAARSS
jgi:hypothetical protein